MNLPGTDGREVLRTVKADPDLMMIPVVVLTVSQASEDINRCYKEGANTYIQKPVDFERFIRAMESLGEYWFEVAILPRGG